MFPALLDDLIVDIDHDRRSVVVSTDARKYLEDTDEVFDVIITDLSEPVEEGPAYLLYTREFYQMALGRLSPKGTLSLQAGTAAIPYLLGFLETKLLAR